MKKFFVLSLTALLFAACASNDVDSVDDSKLVYIGEKEASDYFDFSTSNDVMLTVDYSANSPVAPVFFRVYSENPFNGDELNPNIKPVYSNYTDGQGRFSQSVELPR